VTHKSGTDQRRSSLAGIWTIQPCQRSCTNAGRGSNGAVGRHACLPHTQQRSHLTQCMRGHCNLTASAGTGAGPWGIPTIQAYPTLSTSSSCCCSSWLLCTAWSSRKQCQSIPWSRRTCRHCGCTCHHRCNHWGSSGIHMRAHASPCCMRSAQ